MSQLVDKLESSKDYSAENLDVIFRNLRHVLVLGVDRLDYDTLHLVWLPQLDRVSRLLPEPSIDVQALCHLFALFMVQDDHKTILPSGNQAYERKALEARLEQIRKAKFTRPPNTSNADSKYILVIESIVSMT